MSFVEKALEELNAEMDDSLDCIISAAERMKSDLTDTGEIDSIENVREINQNLYKYVKREEVSKSIRSLLSDPEVETEENGQSGRKY